MDKELFVQNIKKRCAEKGVKPTVACIECGVGKDMVTNLDKRGIMPSIERVAKLAQYLGCTVSELIGEENVKAVVLEDDGQYEEFARIFKELTPENRNEVIAEMLKREQEK